MEDTELNFIGDEDDLDNIIERQGEIENENDDDEDDDGPRGDDEAIEAPGPKKKDDKGKDELKKKKSGTPRPKLDHVRLGSSRGLLALEAETRDLKLRGRGYELEDINLVLGKMQHWAHRLFPSYTFDDCLEKLEKLGSKKIVNVQLKKIRIGLASVDDELDKTLRGDDNIDDEDDAPAPRLRDPDADFDNVMATARPVQPAPPPPVQPSAPTVLTEEQKERIKRNRLAAEERRFQRLREQRERELREQEEAAAEEAFAEMMQASE